MSPAGTNGGRSARANESQVPEAGYAGHEEQWRKLAAKIVTGLGHLVIQELETPVLSANAEASEWGC